MVEVNTERNRAVMLVAMLEEAVATNDHLLLLRLPLPRTRMLIADPNEAFIPNRTQKDLKRGYLFFGEILSDAPKLKPEPKPKT